MKFTESKKRSKKGTYLVEKRKPGRPIADEKIRYVEKLIGLKGFKVARVEENGEKIILKPKEEDEK
ncbi:MAG: hypothetical protein ACFFDN_06980 [Candidatus Hodarchaeota archaeon]